MQKAVVNVNSANSLNYYISNDTELVYCPNTCHNSQQEGIIVKQLQY